MATGFDEEKLEQLRRERMEIQNRYTEGEEESDSVLAELLAIEAQISNAREIKVKVWKSDKIKEALESWFKSENYDNGVLIERCEVELKRGQDESIVAEIRFTQR